MSVVYFRAETGDLEPGEILANIFVAGKPWAFYVSRSNVFLEAQPLDPPDRQYKCWVKAEKHGTENGLIFVTVISQGVSTLLPVVERNLSESNPTVQVAAPD